MRRRKTVLLAFAVLAALTVASVSLASANKHSSNSSGYGYTIEPHQLSWAIVSHGNVSNSDTEGLHDLDELQGKYGDEFIYIRESDEDGAARYVIRDHAMVERAYRALEPMQEAGREIGEAVGAKVAHSFSRSQDAREQARVARRIGRLSRQIARLSREGEDTGDLEREQAQLQRELDEIREKGDRGDYRSRRDAELDSKTEKASKHMKDAAKHLKHEIRDIFSEAKERGLAERLD